MENTLITSTKLNDLDEDKLITRTQNGDAEAFNPIVRKYQQRIYNLIYRRIGNHEAAEDLCQEVFLKAWQALPGFKKKSVFYSWLYQIAINCSIDFLRKQKNQIVFPCEKLSVSADDFLQMLHTHPSPHEILEKEEFEYLIHEAAGQLPPGQYRVFYLRYQEELSIKEIAAHLNKSEGTIKTHLHYTHRKLRNMLRPYLQNEFLKWFNGI
ncbi:sigma-70 family RNA polymerase sigma factor [Candidatus Poribacteria bacterium]|nr:sigma-70 family RNA polymerase sigma factor [Candidatus Poribacteria bacterium]